MFGCCFYSSFPICQSELSFAGMNQSNSKIEINKQNMTTTKRGHCCLPLAFRKVRFSGHISTVLGPLTNAVYIQKSSFWPTDLHIRNEKKPVF